MEVLGISFLSAKKFPAQLVVHGKPLEVRLTAQKLILPCTLNPLPHLAGSRQVGFSEILMLFYPMLSLLLAASLTVAWDTHPSAVQYVLWSGPVGGDYTQVALTTNTTHTVSNLAFNQSYRLGLAALSRTNGSEIVEITAQPRQAILYLEWSQSTTGAWTVKASNVVEAGPGFYRGRVELR